MVLILAKHSVKFNQGYPTALVAFSGLPDAVSLSLAQSHLGGKNADTQEVGGGYADDKFNQMGGIRR